MVDYSIQIFEVKTANIFTINLYWEIKAIESLF